MLHGVRDAESKGHPEYGPNQLIMYHTMFDLEIGYKLVLFDVHLLIGHPWSLVSSFIGSKGFTFVCVQCSA